MLPFLSAPNLTAKTLVEVHPWDFEPSEDELKKVRAMRKEARRQWTLLPSCRWQVYSAFKGLIPSARICKTNPPQTMHGLVVDYDMKSDVETVMNFVRQMPAEMQPNFIEISIGLKIRLIWVFETPINCASFEHTEEILQKFHSKLNTKTLLAGYDPASEKPTEMWTNGGVWYEVKQTPLSKEFCFGVACDVANKTNLFCRGEIPLHIIADEIAAKFPGRWKGEFKEGALGIRFWVPTADCPTGAQVKPDGMLCFTGTQPFVSWSEIFGAAWVNEQRALNLGKAGDGIFFDGKNYWENNAARWVPLARTDTILLLKNRGLSDKTPKGVALSDAERVLRHIQSEGRVEGAAPLINYRPGLVNVDGRRLLNTSTVRALEPAPEADCTGDPNVDCPYIWNLFKNIFPRPELNAIGHFVAWLARAYRSILTYTPLSGQAIFICGPKHNGKTLIVLRIIAPLLGNRYTCPIDYFVGDTQFNDDIFESTLLAINDEDSPKNDASRLRFATRIKAFVVNPTHTYHPKFCPRVTVHWQGRIANTLNDDPASVGMLPEVNSNTEDKMMFFATHDWCDKWDENHIIEAKIAHELPKLGRYLVSVKIPDELKSGDRCGVRSFYDPVILELSKQQGYSYNFVELLKVWIDTSWEPDKKEWEGTTTELMALLSTCDTLVAVVRDWTVPKAAKSLTTASRTPDGGIEYIDGRRFKIIRSKLNK
jgi:hypothetical protein